MVISRSCLLTPNFIPTPIKPLTKTFHLNSSLLCNCSYYSCSKRVSRLPAIALVSTPPIDAESLENEFSGHGVTFSGISGSCVVKMALENGSVAKLILPSGLITSYKALMWHGGTVELLHTLVTEGEDGGSLIHGGVSLAFTCDIEGISWSPNTWVLHDVKGNPKKSIQVELISKNEEGNAEVKHIITLTEDLLSSEIVICNSNASSLHFMGSVISHLTVSTPEATHAIGLVGSDFFNRPPVLTDFSLIHPSFGKGEVQGSRKTKGVMAFMDLFSSWGGRNQKHGDGDDVKRRMGETEEMLEGEEEDNYKNLAEEMCRIYTSAPRNFTLIDRGRRNSVVVGRDGFNELYMFSPGSSHEWYGKYAYVCVGQAALLKPITLGSHSEWRGEQHLYNPNL